MLSDQIINELQLIVGKDNVFTSKADRICYSYDATQQSFLPDVVVHPGSTDEISRIMKLANTEMVPVFPRGAGSGFTGGSLPTLGGIVLCTERMDRILEIDEDNLVATVEPGVIWKMGGGSRIDVDGAPFAETADLYSMPQHAADVILAEQHR